MNDIEIIEQFMDGHTEVFEHLLDRYESKIFRVVLGLTCHSQDAQDLTQEVFIKVYQKLDTFNHQSSLGHWISRIAINHSRNFLRRKKIVQFLSFEWLIEKKGDDFQSLSSCYDPGFDSESKERVNALMKALDQLSYDHRELIVLKEFNELDYKQISEVIGIPMGTVKSRLSRAKQELKKILTKMEVNDG